VRFAVVQNATNKCGGTMLCQVATRLIPQHLLFFRKLEVHALISIVVSCGLRVAGGIASANTLAQD
jgi:hypothetical protein